MEWSRRQEELVRQLPPEVAMFVRQVLRSLEQENVFDAPGVISGVLRRMRIADSNVIREAASRTEMLLKQVFGQGWIHRVGA